MHIHVRVHSEHEWSLVTASCVRVCVCVGVVIIVVILSHDSSGGLFCQHQHVPNPVSHRNASIPSLPPWPVAHPGRWEREGVESQLADSHPVPGKEVVSESKKHHSTKTVNMNMAQSIDIHCIKVIYSVITHNVYALSPLVIQWRGLPRTLEHTRKLRSEGRDFSIARYFNCQLLVLHILHMLGCRVSTPMWAVDVVYGVTKPGDSSKLIYTGCAWNVQSVRRWTFFSWSMTAQQNSSTYRVHSQLLKQSANYLLANVLHNITSVPRCLRVSGTRWLHVQQLTCDV